MMRISFLPQAWRHRARTAIEARSVRMDECVATAMASYGNAHVFPFGFLRDHKLLAQLVEMHLEGKFRLISPMEFVILHGTLPGTQIPEDSRLAQHVVGNQLVIVHALAILKEAFVHQGILSQDRARHLLTESADLFLQPANLQVERRGHFWFLSRREVMPSPISPTQPMPGMHTVECHHAGTMAKLQGGIECTVRAVLESKGILFDNWAIMRDNSKRIMLQPEENWRNINQPLHFFELTFCIEPGSLHCEVKQELMAIAKAASRKNSKAPGLLALSWIGHTYVEQLIDKAKTCLSRQSGADLCCLPLFTKQMATQPSP